ncbi:DUF2628 domain-containing protein [Anderseniella sp. Alg231-50]|uniref:DUF2628 domain-containing protein n=1 Tax=Anderseniella sp. Alg231-50 TaxID=1922226 RepID=UPI000D559F37
MLTYTAHSKQDPPQQDHAEDTKGVVFVKDGFSWPAFFIPFFWMLWHRLWLPLVGYLVAVGLVVLAGYAFSWPDNLTSGMGILVNLFAGLEGNNFRRRALAKRGFEEVADIVAGNGEEASYRFFTARLSDQNG